MDKLESYIQRIQDYHKNIDLKSIDKDFFEYEKKMLSFLNARGVKEDTYFYKMHVFSGVEEQGQGEDLYSVEQIIDYYYENNGSEFFIDWDEDEFDFHIRDRFLQLTSIEGGGSYFYEPATDYIYNVNWGEEYDMMKGTLKPWFTSSKYFFEWYYENVDLMGILKKELAEIKK